MNLSLKPSSRTADVIVQEIDGEVLIYDLNSHQALALNETASKVWNLLDGKSTISDIAETAQIPVEIVMLSIDELQKKDLLEEKVEMGLAKDRVSRRKMLASVAASAVALPVIASIIAPTAAHAQSGCPSIGPMLAPGAMNPVSYFGVCGTGASCPGACENFNVFCCSNQLLFAGTCTNNPGPPATATCDCICA